ncbi:MAG: alginate export family protein, partial [Gammaproteobacteria bacterium]
IAIFTSARALPLLLFIVLAPHGWAAEQAAPWRLSKALNTPEWLSLSGTFRTRIENMDDRFRVGRSGSDQAVVTRLTFKTELKFGQLVLGGELIDSRAFFNDKGSNISTGSVNSAELLQGYLRWTTNDFISAESTSTLTAGRMTLDVGSRRLVARNRYRNTINTFTGLDWRWQAASGREFRAVYLLPVQRLPGDRASLLDNDSEFDDESSNVSFWGLFYKMPASQRDALELFVFGLNEHDSNRRPTRNREITTAGFRLFRNAALSRFDYVIESAIQFGESRTSTALNNTTDLDHLAHFHHAEIGYSFNYVWQPQLLFQYDYASGDDSPLDGDNNRFDTLFGARRFEWGPTGIYGPFARANLNTPGLRLKLKPANTLSSFIAYRGYWLASDKDAWTTAGVRDPSGSTDGFLGHQVEVRVRYNPAPNNVQLEFGVAHLFAGDFIEHAPNANDADDVTYAYSQITLKF